MTATFRFAEANGSPLSWTGSIANWNMGSTDSAELDPDANPVTAGSASFEKWVVGSWAGTFNQVDNVQFWMSAGSFGTGEKILWSGSGLHDDYNAGTGSPTDSKTSFPVGSIPEADPGTANVGIGSPVDLSGSLTTTGSSNFIVTQYHTETSASPGKTNTKTMKIEWDEQEEEIGTEAEKAQYMGRI